MRFDVQHEAAQYVADVVALIAINFHYHLYRSGSLVEHGPIVVHRTAMVPLKVQGSTPLQLTPKTVLTELLFSKMRLSFIKKSWKGTEVSFSID